MVMKRAEPYLIFEGTLNNPSWQRAYRLQAPIWRCTPPSFGAKSVSHPSLALFIGATTNDHDGNLDLRSRMLQAVTVGRQNAVFPKLF